VRPLPSQRAHENRCKVAPLVGRGDGIAMMESSLKKITKDQSRDTGMAMVLLLLLLILKIRMRREEE
jgi:hypothetical protein